MYTCLELLTSFHFPDFSDVLSDGDDDWQDVDITPQSQKVAKSKRDGRKSTREVRTSRRHHYSRTGKSDSVGKFYQ